MDQGIQLPAQQLSPVLDDLPAAPRRELLVLEFLLDAGKLHVRGAFTRAHQRGRANKTRQLITGEKHLFHLLFGDHIGAYFVAVAAYGMDHLLTHPGRTQQLRGLYAVLFGPFLKVDIVQQAAHGPKISFFAIAQVVGKPAHYRLHSQCVPDVEGLLIVLPQQGQGRFAGDHFFHFSSSFR